MCHPPCSDGIEVRTTPGVTWLDEAIFALHAECFVLALLDSESKTHRRAFQFEIEPYHNSLRAVILAPYDLCEPPASV